MCHIRNRPAYASAVFFFCCDVIEHEGHSSTAISFALSSGCHGPWLPDVKVPLTLPSFLGSFNLTISLPQMCIDPCLSETSAASNAKDGPSGFHKYFWPSPPPRTQRVASLFLRYGRRIYSPLSPPLRSSSIIDRLFHGIGGTCGSLHTCVQSHNIMPFRFKLDTCYAWPDTTRCRVSVVANFTVIHLSLAHQRARQPLHSSRAAPVVYVHIIPLSRQGYTGRKPHPLLLQWIIHCRPSNVGES